MSEKKSKKNITLDRLLSVISYDKLTGKFTWKKQVGVRGVAGSSAGSVDAHGYLVIMIDGISDKAHRLAWLYEFGYLPENDIDHINMVRNDNRICNLREVSRSCNVRNTKNRSTNKTGIKGVCVRKGTGKFHAQIRIKEKNIHLGYYANIFDAASARYNAEVKYGFPVCSGDTSAKSFIEKF